MKYLIQGLMIFAGLNCFNSSLAFAGNIRSSVRTDTIGGKPAQESESTVEPAGKTDATGHVYIPKAFHCEGNSAGVSAENSTIKTFTSGRQKGNPDKQSVVE